jgi:hypothetical protein
VCQRLERGEGYGSGRRGRVLRYAGHTVAISLTPDAIQSSAMHLPHELFTL